MTPTLPDDDDVVPCFDNVRKQIKFESRYTVCVAASAIVVVILVQLIGIHIPSLIDQNTKVLTIAVAGGLLGGWVYCTKWFLRVVSGGKTTGADDLKWEKRKFYWRIFAPHLAGLVAFSMYLLATSLIPIGTIDPRSGRAAFAFCFIFGYFSDLTLSGLAGWAESFFQKNNGSKES